MGEDILFALAAAIKDRRSADAETSYTRKLLDGGPEKCAKKFGEEAVETMIAALKEPDAALRAETADLLFHLLVLLESRNIPLSDVLTVLEGRFGTSGLEEKASRKAR